MLWVRRVNVQDKSRPNVHFIREAELYDAGTYRVALWTDTGSDLKEFNLTVYAADDPMCKGVHSAALSSLWCLRVSASEARDSYEYVASTM